MQHNWFNHSDQANFNTNTAFLSRYRVPKVTDANNQLLCFSHVPKTGGTSLETILTKNFLLSEVLHVNAPDLNKQADLLTLKKNHPKLICGHHPMHGLLYQLIPEQPIFHLTQLRHPVDRVLSYYNYVRGKTDHPMHEHALGQSITDFLQSDSSPELSNGQAKRFSGNLHSDAADETALFLTAQATLDQCFSLVLTTCLFDEGLLLLKTRLGLQDIYYMRSNVSKRFIRREQLSANELRLIESMNQADIKLFAWAKQNCLKQIEQELSSEAINTFKSNNQKWAELVGASNLPS